MSSCLFHASSCCCQHRRVLSLTLASRAVSFSLSIEANIRFSPPGNRFAIDRERESEQPMMMFVRSFAYQFTRLSDRREPFCPFMTRLFAENSSQRRPCKCHDVCRPAGLALAGRQTFWRTFSFFCFVFQQTQHKAQPRAKFLLLLLLLPAESDINPLKDAPMSACFTHCTHWQACIRSGQTKALRAFVAAITKPMLLAGANSRPR